MSADTNDVLFGRLCRVTIWLVNGSSFSDTDPTQNGIVISGGDADGNLGLRIVFKGDKTVQKHPNTFEISIYNLAPSTRGKIQSIGARVLVEAGYVATGLSQLFLGDVRTVDSVRSNADWISTLTCGDGERAIRFARASNSFAGGTTVGQVVNYCAGAMGLSVGNSGTQAAKLNKVLQHGWTVSASASTELGRILRAVGYDYSVQDGAVQVLAPDESVDQTIQTIRDLRASEPNTGLIGSPEFGSPEKKGQPQLLKYKSLLSPSTRPGGRDRITSERFPNGAVFRIRKATHTGDTRSGQWYTECESVAETVTK